MRTIGALVLVAVALTACGSYPPAGPRLADDPAPARGTAVVYLYNGLPVALIGGSGCPKFSVDGSSFVPLPSGSYARFDLAAGAHRITTQTSWCFAPNIKRQVTAGEAQPVFLRLTRKFYPWEGSDRKSAEGGWVGFEEVPPETARQEMAELRRAN